MVFVKSFSAVKLKDIFVVFELPLARAIPRETSPFQPLGLFSSSWAEAQVKTKKIQ
jgi:hypothetical protein